MPANGCAALAATQAAKAWGRAARLALASVVIGEFGPLDGVMTLEDTANLMTQAEAADVPYLGWTFHGRCVPSLAPNFEPNWRIPGKRRAKDMTEHAGMR